MSTTPKRGRGSGKGEATDQMEEDLDSSDHKQPDHKQPPQKRAKSKLVAAAKSKVVCASRVTRSTSARGSASHLPAGADMSFSADGTQGCAICLSAMADTEAGLPVKPANEKKHPCPHIVHQTCLFVWCSTLWRRGTGEDAKCSLCRMSYNGFISENGQYTELTQQLLKAHDVWETKSPAPVLSAFRTGPHDDNMATEADLLYMLHMSAQLGEHQLDKPALLPQLLCNDFDIWSSVILKYCSMATLTSISFIRSDRHPWICKQASAVEPVASCAQSASASAADIKPVMRYRMMDRCIFQSGINRAITAYRTYSFSVDLCTGAVMLALSISTHSALKTLQRLGDMSEHSNVLDKSWMFPYLLVSHMMACMVKHFPIVRSNDAPSGLLTTAKAKLGLSREQWLRLLTIHIEFMKR
jgi:hypothetical protein